MSIFYRKQYHREQLFLKVLHLTDISKTLVKILPIGFSSQEYLEVFKLYYPHLWEDIYSYCRTRKNDYLRRKKKCLRTVQFMDPNEFLLLHTKIKHVSKQTLSDKEIKDLKALRSNDVLMNWASYAKAPISTKFQETLYPRW